MPENKQISKINEFITSKTGEQLKDLLVIILSGLPGGSVFGTIIDKKMPDRKIEKLKKFSQELRDEIEKLKKAINEDYITSEEFYYLFEQTFLYVSRNYQEEKINAFRNILLKSIVDIDTNQDIKEMYLHITNELSVADIRLLKGIYRGGRVSTGGLNYERATEKDDMEMWNDLLANFNEEVFNIHPGESSKEIEVTIYHLLSKNLIRDVDPIYEYYRNMSQSYIRKDVNEKNGEFYYDLSTYLTALGKGLIIYIQDIEHEK